MKKLLLLTVSLLGCFAAAQAQDLITTRSGEDIEAKVLEVRTKEVKYKKFSFLDGPTYSISKKDILMIRYENGEKDIFDGYSDYTPQAEAQVHPGMHYRDYKFLYKPRLYVRQPYDRYSPGWSGFASVVIPGLGQAINGEWGRAATFFTLNILSNVMINGRRKYDAQGNYYYDESVVPYVIIGAIVDIWSVFDAVRVAKVKNMYEQDMRGLEASVDMKVEPFLTYMPAGTVQGCKPAAGLSLKVRF